MDSWVSGDSGFDFDLNPLHGGPWTIAGVDGVEVHADLAFQPQTGDKYPLTH